MNKVTKILLTPLMLLLIVVVSLAGLIYYRVLVAAYEYAWKDKW